MFALCVLISFSHALLLGGRKGGREGGRERERERGRERRGEREGEIACVCVFLHSEREIEKERRSEARVSPTTT